MKIFKLFAICAIALIATSCGSVNKSKSYSFDSVRLEVNMNDLVCLGEADISVEYSTYLWGAFSNIEKVNELTETLCNALNGFSKSKNTYF